MSRVPSLQRIVSSRLGLQPQPTILDSLVRHIVSKMNHAVRDFNAQIRDTNLNEHFIPYYLYFDVFLSQVHYDLNELEKKLSFSSKSLEDKYYVYQTAIEVLRIEDLEEKVQRAITNAQVDLQMGTAQDVEEHKEFVKTAKRSLEHLYTLHERLKTVSFENNTLDAVVMKIDITVLKFKNDNLSQPNMICDERMIPFYKHLEDMIKRVNRYLKKLRNNDNGHNDKGHNDSHMTLYGEVIRKKMDIEGLEERIKVAIEDAENELKNGSVNEEDLQEYEIYLNVANKGLKQLQELSETL